MLVGDLVQGIREAITDQSQTLPTPLISSVTPIIGDGTIGFGPLVIVATLTTPWGETDPSTEFALTLSSPNTSVQIVVNVFGWQRAYPIVTGINIYIGAASNQEILKFSFVGSRPGDTLTISNSIPVTYQNPTLRNSAYLPDTDGDKISAAIMFRWINDGLKLASGVCGGLLDYSGISTVSGVPQYIIPGQWKKISSLWYDGYPLGMDDAGNYFRRNTITASILASVATSLLTDRMMLEIWPQPSRTAASTTLASQLSATDTQAVLNSTAGFLLTNGFVKIGNEIMSYSGMQGNILKNLIRGLSGTVAAIVAAGQPVNELNMFWQGWRAYAPNFQPGDSLLTVPAPVGWETQLFKYGLGRAKLAEQGVGDFTKLEQDFMKNLRDWWNSNNVSVGPRQIGDQSDGLQVLENLGGGWVIP